MRFYLICFIFIIFGWSLILITHLYLSYNKHNNDTSKYYMPSNNNKKNNNTIKNKEFSCQIPKRTPKEYYEGWPHVPWLIYASINTIDDNGIVTVFAQQGNKGCYQYPPEIIKLGNHLNRPRKYACEYSTTTGNNIIVEDRIISELQPDLRGHQATVIVRCPISNKLWSLATLANETTTIRIRLFRIDNNIVNESQKTAWLPICSIPIHSIAHHLLYPQKMWQFVLSTKLYGTDTRIIEWLEFHKLHGVDHVYIFDNSEVPYDSTYNILKPYIKEQFVSYIYWPLKDCLLPTHNVSKSFAHSQIATQAITISWLKNRAKYMSFIDVDEYLIPNDGKKALLDIINGYLGNHQQTEKKKQYNVIGLRPRQTIPCGKDIKKYKTNQQLQNYHDIVNFTFIERYHCLKDDHIQMFRRKLIIRPDQIMSIHVHYPIETWKRDGTPPSEILLNKFPDKIVYFHARRMPSDWFPRSKEAVDRFDMLSKYLPKLRPKINKRVNQLKKLGITQFDSKWEQIFVRDS